MYINDTSCCGLREIEGLSEHNTSKDAMKEACRQLLGGYRSIDCSFVLFTGVTAGKYAEKFSKFIKKNELGTVVCTKSKRNPNSRNNIKAYLWTPNVNNLRAWWSKNKTKEDDEDYYW